VATPTPVVAGVVRDDDGHPVAAARVYVVDAPVPVPDIAALSGPDGTFSVGLPVAGRYTMEAAAEGRAPARATFEVVPGHNWLDLRLGG
jgi:hypothetical protein